MIERWMFGSIAPLMFVVGIDSGRVPYSHLTTWIVIYTLGAAACLAWAVTLRLAALQACTILLGIAGLARSFLYLIGPEHRLTPIGLNGTIGMLLLIYHRERRLDAT